MRRGHLLAFFIIATLTVASPGVRGDTVKILDSAEDAAGARVEMIRRAEHSIDALYYTVANDSVALAVLALLRDAARRGVAVRFVIDGHFNDIPDDIETMLVRDGIQIREYHPFRPWRPNWWTRRLHDKLLIADRTSVITGGRNIAATYYGRGAEVGRRDYIDRDVFVEGEAAAAAAAYFDRIWAGPKVVKTNLAQYREARLSRRCELLIEPADRERCERLRLESLADLNEADRLLERQHSILATDPLLAPALDGGPSVSAREVGRVQFLHDPASGKREDAGIGVAMVEILDGARESLLIETPYLIPSYAVESSLRAAVSRGVKVRVLTNALTATDNLLAQAVYFGAKGDIVSWGVELWEFPGPDCMHAKSMVVDRRLTVVGSFNLDPRSESLNTEVAVVIDDAAVASEVSGGMESRIAVSVQIGPDGEPLPGSIEPPKAPLWKRTSLRVLELIAPMLREQL